MAAKVIPNSDITVYNKYIDGSTRSEKYQRTVIYSVVWQATRAISGARTGLLASNVALVLIPFERKGATYLDPKAWLELADKAGYWTLKNDDVIVRGVCTDEITDAVAATETDPAVPAYTMTNLRQDNEEVVVISSIDAMDQGSPNVQHFEVGCK